MFPGDTGRLFHVVKADAAKGSPTVLSAGGSPDSVVGRLAGSPARPSVASAEEVSSALPVGSTRELLARIAFAGSGVRPEDMGTALASLAVTGASGATTGPVAYAVSVLGDGVDGTPSGTVTLSDNAGGKCTGTLDGAGDASCTIVENATNSPLAIDASYSGDDNYAPVTGTDVTSETVAVASPTVVLTGGADTTQAGYVDYTATVSGPSGADVPSGTVTVSDGVGGGCVISLAGGTGTCSAPESTSGYVVSAEYSGDANYALVTGVHDTPTVSVTDTAGPVAGESFAFTAVVAGPGPAVTPTGTVAWVLTGPGSPSCQNPSSSELSSGTASCVLAGATVGTYTAVATYSGDSEYTGASGSDTTATVSQSTPSLTWAAPADIVYGTALSATQLDASASVAGSFTYSPPAGTVLGAGNNQSLSVSFTPSDTTDYTTATASTQINVKKATPSLTWAAPADIVYGTALSATQLDASASVAGSFTYSPPAGTVLGAGNNQSLSVSFTPSDTTDYTTATASTQINVKKATPSLTWAAPADIVYGTALSATQLDASASVAGSFTYSPPAGTVLGAGNNQSLSVSFTPSDTTDYTTATASTQINVKKATPSLTWAAPADIVYGTALSATQLDASASVAGSFTYSPPAGTVLGAGNNQSLSVSFTPSDTTDYTTATASTQINVKKATPSLTWAAPADIVYGTALSATQLDASASVAGSFTYSPPAGTVLGAGNNQSLSVSFTPSDTTDYTTATASTQINVKKATPSLTWAAPADIVYGTALSATQLDASASVAGSFTYSPPAGTVLGAGNNQSLSVSFTPSDTTDYTTATASTQINVKKATPSLTWAAPADIVYGTALSATQLDASASVAGSFTYSPPAGTVLGAGNNQSLSVSFTPSDTTDYTTATASTQINVKKATPSLTWAAPADIVYGTALSATQLDASASVAGSFTYSPPAGTVLGAGNNQSLSVSFTPSDTTDYTTATASTQINVKKATPSLTWAAPADIVYGTALSATQLDASASVAGSFTYSPPAGTVLGAGNNQSLSVSFTPSDTTDYTTATASTQINVKKATPSLTWAAPADIVYGTALSATQLDASASVAGSFTYSPPAGTVLGAGNNQSLSVSFTPSDTTDYTTATASTQINVKKATLTVTADDLGMTYGSNPPKITYHTGGLVDSDTIVGIGLAVTCTTSATDTSGAGTPQTTGCSGASSTTNYNVSYASGTMTVSQAQLTIEASSGSQTYGSTPPVITPTYLGFVLSQSPSVLTTAPTCVSGTTTSSSVSGSPYASSCSGAVASNYQIGYLNGSVTVKPAILTVSVTGTRVFGGSPSYSAIESGFVNGEGSSVVTGALSCSTNSTSSSPVGDNYTISSCSGLASANYSMSYGYGALSVTPAALAITASSPSVSYGSAPPTITASYSGLVNGNTPASLTTDPTCSSTATTLSPPGNYGSSCTGAVDTNYAITYVGGSVTVTQATPTVTVSGQSAQSTGPVTISVSVSGPNGAAAPTGSVTVTDANATCLISNLDSSGAGTCALIENASEDGKAVTVSYSGDTNYVSASGNTTESVSPAEPTVTLSGPSSAVTGEIFYNVTVGGGGATPTGSVEISDTNTKCSAVLIAGIGSCYLQEKTGNYQLTANYTPASGDGNYLAASGTANEVVDESNTVLSVSAGTLVYGLEQSASFSVTVTGPPGETMPTSSSAQVVAGSQSLCEAPLSLTTVYLTNPVSGQPVPDPEDVGTCTPGPGEIPAGTYTVTALFPGVSSLVGSTSTPAALTVVSAPTSTALSVSRKTTTYGNETNTVLIANVIESSVGPALVTGNVSFMSGGATVCVAAISQGVSMCRLTGAQLPVGPHSFVAAYGGTTSLLSSSSGPVTLTVAKAATTSALSMSDGIARLGLEQHVKFTVRVRVPLGMLPAGGIVEVMTGSKNLCAVRLVRGTGSCSLKASELPAGTYSVLARYGGSSTNDESASRRQTLVITKPPLPHKKAKA